MRSPSRRLWLSFQTPADRGKLTCARRAFWRHRPRGAWVSLGLSAHLTRMARDPAVDIKSRNQLAIAKRGPEEMGL